MIGGTARELDAAGIHGPQLRAAFSTCRALNAEHGTTYYLATLLLPAAKRPAVHALYGFARWVDDLIDEAAPQTTTAELERCLHDVAAVLTGHTPHDDARDPAPLLALRDTIRQWNLPVEYFTAFLASMRMDLTVDHYDTYSDLEQYMWGSAAVIGLQMLPILQPALPPEVAAPYAIDLGVAFQLTNFLRDVGEDLRRGRIYLPMDSLHRHGVDRQHLQRGVIDGPIRRLLAEEIARTREIYRSAAPGVRLLHPTSRACVQTALSLYSNILDEIERRDYDVFTTRARVSKRRRITVAIPGLLAAHTSRWHTNSYHPPST